MSIIDVIGIMASGPRGGLWSLECSEVSEVMTVGLSDEYQISLFTYFMKKTEFLQMLIEEAIGISEEEARFISKMKQYSLLTL